MNFVRLLPAIISILLLGAHYYRAGFMFLVIIASASTLLLMIRQPWAVRIIQVLLFIAGIEWIKTAIELVDARQSMNIPWIRLAIILGGAAILAFGSIFVFRFKSLRKRYRILQE